MMILEPNKKIMIWTAQIDTEQRRVHVGTAIVQTGSTGQVTDWWPKSKDLDRHRMPTAKECHDSRSAAFLMARELWIDEVARWHDAYTVLISDFERENQKGEG